MKAFAAFMVLAVLAAPALASRELLAPSSGITDADILNFALNLEYLEAEFYSWAAFGKGLDSSLTGGGPASIGGQKAQLSPAAQSYAEEIAQDEINHVAFLRSALGSAAVPRPLINIGTAFAAAADAALNTTLSPPFTPYANDIFFYHGAFIFEDLGVTAYNGAAPLISTPAYLGAAASILAVEAYHGGVIRLLLNQNVTYETPYGVPVETIVGAIADLENAAGGVDASQNVVTVANGVTSANLTPTNANSLAYTRTPMEVLAIAYLGSASTPGGFFPNGLNGNVK